MAAAETTSFSRFHVTNARSQTWLPKPSRLSLPLISYFCKSRKGIISFLKDTSSCLKCIFIISFGGDETITWIYLKSSLITLQQSRIVSSTTWNPNNSLQRSHVKHRQQKQRGGNFKHMDEVWWFIFPLLHSSSPPICSLLFRKAFSEGSEREPKWQREAKGRNRWKADRQPLLFHKWP